MPADVCVQTRRRCPHPERCAEEKCPLNRQYYPMFESRLTKDEQYWLQIGEQRRAREASK